MSLENVRLPASVIRELYKNCLVNPVASATVSLVDPLDPLSFLGGNAAKITIVVNDTRAAFLSDDNLTFLSGILAACGLTIGDVAIVNLNKTPAINHKDISSRLKAGIVLLLGINPDQIALPIYFPPFQVQQFNEQRFLHAPDLADIRNNREDKKKLWDSLKILFAIK